jgi:hypothetical protein
MQLWLERDMISTDLTTGRMTLIVRRRNTARFEYDHSASKLCRNDVHAGTGCRLSTHAFGRSIIQRHEIGSATAGFVATDCMSREQPRT